MSAGHVFSSITKPKSNSAVRAYGVYPVRVGGDLCEDGGLLGEVAAETQTKADNAVNLPGAGTVPAVQWATGVALGDVRGNIASVH